VIAAATLPPNYRSACGDQSGTERYNRSNIRCGEGLRAGQRGVVCGGNEIFEGTAVGDDVLVLGKIAEPVAVDVAVARERFVGRFGETDDDNLVVDESEKCRRRATGYRSAG
jgi:hypothetical protein